MKTVRSDSGLGSREGRRVSRLLPDRLPRRAGQAIVIMALTGLLMMGGVGLAVDLAIGFMYSVAAERAAAAAALSGVVFMPDQFDSTSAVPLGSRNDATDRAIDEAHRNGFDPLDTTSRVRLTVSRVLDHPNRLEVTVSRDAPVFMMQLFGFTTYRVSRTATATYLPPISLGERGGQLGSTVSDLGRTRFFFMRTEGWANDRGQGDAYTPNPNGGSAGASDDVHQISYTNRTTAQDATLADRGGYEYQINIPAGPGAVIQVYNAAFAPDGFGPTANFCDNDNQVPSLRRCSIRGANWMREEEAGPASLYSTMRYSLYRVLNPFIHTSDVLLSQLTVYPIDARNWSTGRYLIMGGPNLGQTVMQQYAGGQPTNMLIYHNWIDVATYGGAQDRGLVRLRQLPAFGSYFQGGAMVAGSYRLRVDTLDNMGTSFTNPLTTGHKGYAVRAANAGPSPTLCSNCQVAALAEICFITTFDAGAGGAFTMDLFHLPRDYAGLTVNIDIWDVGDIASTSGVTVINILDPSGAVASSPQGINIYDLGSQRSNLATRNYVVLANAGSNRLASFVAQNTRTGQSTDNEWIHLEIPVPANYNPPTGQGWWSLQYVTSPGTIAFDTVTVALGLKGGPVHLLP
jgi:hypothetical protein